MNNDLYHHEAILQLAKEFGLQEITAQDLSMDEITDLLEAINTELWNPDHYSPAKWVTSFFMFLRQTGKLEMFESPRQVARLIICEYRYL